MPEIEFTPTEPAARQMLPILDDRKVVSVEYKTARAVIQPIPGELRIPFVKREESGDFADMMDELIGELDGYTRVRFVATSSDHELGRLMQKIAPDDARDIHDVLHGFDVEWIQEYEGSDENVVPVETLVGDWEPGIYDG